MAASALLVRELRQRTAWPGSYKRVAADLGIGPGHLLNVRAGNAKLSTKTAAKILAKIREDDLALADRIEEELLSSWREELRRRDQ